MKDYSDPEQQLFSFLPLGLAYNFIEAFPYFLAAVKTFPKSSMINPSQKYQRDCTLLGYLLFISCCRSSRVLTLGKNLQQLPLYNSFKVILIFIIWIESESSYKRRAYEQILTIYYTYKKYETFERGQEVNLIGNQRVFLYFQWNSFIIVYNLGMEQSGSSMRRREFRVQIRRKEIEQMLKKRRYELIAQSCISGDGNMNDHHDKVELILQLIKQYPLDYLHNFITNIIQLDPSLQLFLQLSNYSLKQLPFSFTNIIQNTLNIHINNIIIDQHNHSSKIKAFQHQLSQLFYELSNWWYSVDSKSYYNILTVGKQIGNYAHLIHSNIVDFISLVTNVLLIRQRVGLRLDLEVKTAVGDHPMEIQLQMSKCVLMNIFGVEQDEQLCKILPQFINYNGQAIQMIELYHNLFLVKQVPHRLRLKMVSNFINLLQNHPNQMLEHHNEYILTLYSCLKTNSIPINTLQFLEYLQLCNRMIDVVGKLLKVINFKLNNDFGKDQGLQMTRFKINVSHILRELADTKKGQEGLVKMMYYESINQFMCSHLKYSQIPEHQTITSNIFMIFIMIANTTSSQDYFEHQQPRVFPRLLAFINKYLNIQLYEVSQQQYDKILKKLVLLIYNLCGIDNLASKFIEDGMMNKVGVIYHHLRKQSTTAKYIRLYIQELHINLFIHIQKHPHHYLPTPTIFNIFSQLSSFSIILEILKYTKSKEKAIKVCLIFWMFVINGAQEIINGDMIVNCMRESSVKSRLTELQGCENAEIQSYASFILNELDKSQESLHPK